MRNLFVGTNISDAHTARADVVKQAPNTAVHDDALEKPAGSRKGKRPSLDVGYGDADAGARKYAHKTCGDNYGPFF